MHLHRYRLLESTPDCLLLALCQLEDRSYVLSFDDDMLSRKRAAGDDVRFFDAREHSNVSRLVNDDTEQPKLKLVYAPETTPSSSSAADQPSVSLPRRAFLVATVDVPAWTELTWDYGRHYDRHWLPWWQRRPSRGRKAAPDAGLRPHVPSCLDPPQRVRTTAPRPSSLVFDRVTSVARKSAPHTSPFFQREDFSDSDESMEAGSKKPLTRYMRFASQQRGEILRHNPTLTFGEVGEALLLAWARLPDAEKAEFNVDPPGAAPSAGSSSTSNAPTTMPAASARADASAKVVFTRTHHTPDDEPDEEDEGTRWAVEEILSADEGEDEFFDPQFDKRKDTPIELWEAIDLARAESVDERRRGLLRLRELMQRHDLSILERSAKVVPELEAGKPLFAAALYCGSCDLMRWPKPFCDASQWPRMANRIRRDGRLRGRQWGADPRIGGPAQQRGICQCTDDEREASWLRQTAAVSAREQAARDSATCGADHLLAAIADAAAGALDGVAALTPVLGFGNVYEAELNAALAGNALCDALKSPWTSICKSRSTIDASRSKTVAAHCSNTVTTLTKLWMRSLQRLDNEDDEESGSDLDYDSSDDEGYEYRASQPRTSRQQLEEFSSRAFESLGLLLGSVAPALDGLHWVGHACMQRTGVHLGRDVLGLVAQHLRQPRINFVAAGGCAVIVHQVRLFMESGLGPNSVSPRTSTLNLVTLTPCLKLIATLAKDAAATADALVCAEAPSLLARMVQPGLMVHGNGMRLPEDRQMEREAACMEALSAISLSSEHNERAVDFAMAEAEADLQEHLAEEEARLQREAAARRVREAQLAAQREREAAARRVREAQLAAQRERIAEERRARQAQAVARRDAEKECQLHLRPCERHWKSLSLEQQAMARRLGFNETTWVLNDWRSVTLNWAETRDDATNLGFTFATWWGGAGGGVRCPWPQCNGRMFNRKTDHMQHCTAKHGGKRAPPSYAAPTIPAPDRPRPLPSVPPPGVRPPASAPATAPAAAPPAAAAATSAAPASLFPAPARPSPPPPGVQPKATTLEMLRQARDTFFLPLQLPPSMPPPPAHASAPTVPLASAPASSIAAGKRPMENAPPGVPEPKVPKASGHLPASLIVRVPKAIARHVAQVTTASATTHAATHACAPAAPSSLNVASSSNAARKRPEGSAPLGVPNAKVAR